MAPRRPPATADGDAASHQARHMGGRGEGGGLVGKPCWPSLQDVQEGVVIVAGGGRRGHAGKAYSRSTKNPALQNLQQ